MAQVDLINDPRSVLELALNSREFKPVASRLDANSFVLKVVGKEEYFLKEVPIIQYKVVNIIFALVCHLTPPPPPNLTVHCLLSSKEGAATVFSKAL